MVTQERQILQEYDVNFFPFSDTDSKVPNQQNGTTRTQEAPQDPGGAPPLDAAQNRRRPRLPPQRRPPQAQGVPALGHHHPQPSEVRPQRR